MGQLHRTTAMRARYALVAVLTAGLLPAVAPEAVASDHGQAPRFTEVDLVSDVPGRAPLTDPDLVNGWGLTFGPTTPLWVNDNGTGVATLYAGGVNGGPVSKVLTVPIPGGAPTGQQFNDTTDFVVTGSGGTGPSRFIFVGEDGDVSAWHPTLTPGPAVLQAHVDGAVYKGMTLWHTPLGNFLLAADFHGGRIDVFDHAFRRLSLPDGFFTDRHLPPGYAPFNVAVFGDAVYVTYAKQDSGGIDEVHGRGLGFVDVYTDFGQHVRRLVSRGPLNAPWGLAVAPDSFGRFAGHLLVGNFGDGRITVVDRRSGDVEGQLTGTDGRPLTIDGLWGLLPGTQTTGGTDAVWFSAGPDDETHGLVGQIRPAG
jgi:uncharacterized protein (TIGR03118 family)